MQYNHPLKRLARGFLVGLVAVVTSVVVYFTWPILLLFGGITGIIVLIDWAFELDL